MLITIDIQSQEDFDWLRPLLERLLGKNAVQVHVSPQKKREHVDAFLAYTKTHSIKVSQISIPSRDERNER